MNRYTLNDSDEGCDPLTCPVCDRQECVCPPEEPLARDVKPMRKQINIAQRALYTAANITTSEWIYAELQRAIAILNKI
jgi:hypothetical protein